MNYNNSIVPFSRKIDELRFSVQSVRIELWRRYRDSEPVINKHAVIVLQNKNNGRLCIHPLTEFIFHYWKYRAYNSQRLHANYLCSFLNYILIENRIKYKLPSLQELQFSHGTDFLNELTKKERSRMTVRKAERTLTSFYEFLVKKKLLIHIEESAFKKQNLYGNSNQKYTVSPFKGVIMPRNKQGHIAHDLPEQYILPLIEMAVKMANPIALGIYMQCFGGIRQGELVNIRRSDVISIGSFGEFGIVIKLQQKNMRTDIKDSSGSSGVKKPRRQIVFPIQDWLQSLYRFHIGAYTPEDGSDALFVNRDGKAMSGQSYRAYFSKLKKEFLKQLRKSSNPDDIVYAVKLEEYKWSTHLGRGIFTNLLAEEADNPYDIALPRGDSNLSSSLVYQGNTERMRKKLESRMQQLYDNYLPNLIKK
ncbi:site-specific integrase [Paenibacillus periandrae]|uniref:site-specific integrase n=1 Tax=Paenibacillus periandrae TaxID=1761741 RepID=UPI001F08C4A7|nr:site-specific integrase [Paenibacillus periandrae]